MARFKISMQGNKALIQGLEKLSKYSKELVKEEVRFSTERIHTDAISTIMKSINDKGSLQLLTTPQFDGSKIIGVVESRAHYAPYVEFGTGGMVNVPEGLETYAMQFKGKGVKQVNLKPRPFLFPAFEAEKPKLIERINRGLEKLTN